MKCRYFLVALLVLFDLNSFTNASETDGKDSGQQCTAPQPKFPFGDYRNCFFNGNLSPRLETLPGLGWDNLRNRVSGMVAFFNYSQCRTTEDGRYLIPDDVFVTPIKESKAALFSELIDHWTNYSSTTSKSVNVEAHESFFGSISGSYSSEYSEVKTHQVSSKDARSLWFCFSKNRKTEVDFNFISILRRKLTELYYIYLEPLETVLQYFASQKCPQKPLF